MKRTAAGMDRYRHAVAVEHAVGNLGGDVRQA